MCWPDLCQESVCLRCCHQSRLFYMKWIFILHLFSITLSHFFCGLVFQTFLARVCVKLAVTNKVITFFLAVFMSYALLYFPQIFYSYLHVPCTTGIRHWFYTKTSDVDWWVFKKPYLTSDCAEIRYKLCRSFNNALNVLCLERSVAFWATQKFSMGWVTLGFATFMVLLNLNSILPSLVWLWIIRDHV